MKKPMMLFMAVCLATGVMGGNLGHRLGGDVFDEPENTLACYRKALERLQGGEFKYVEFDVQETKDGHAVVYHDTDGISRIVPDTRHNRAVLAHLLPQKEFKSITIQDLTLSEVQALRLKGDARIPTLKEVLEKSIEWKLLSPMLVEVKLLITDRCRREVIETVAAYKDEIDVNFLAFPKNLARSFPDTKTKWAKLFRKHGLKVYEAKKPKTDKYALIK